MSHHESKRPEPSVIAARPVHSSPFVKWYRHQGRSPRRGTQYVPGMSARPRVDSLHAYDTPPQGRAGQTAALTPETRNPTFPSDEARLPTPSLSPPINLMSRLSLQSTLSWRRRARTRCRPPVSIPTTAPHRAGRAASTTNSHHLPRVPPGIPQGMPRPKMKEEPTPQGDLTHETPSPRKKRRNPSPLSLLLLLLLLLLFSLLERTQPSPRRSRIYACIDVAVPCRSYQISQKPKSPRKSESVD